MNKVFEKILERLEEMIHPKQLYFCKYARGGCKHLDNDDKDCMECVVENAIEIVKQEAEQYNNAIIDGKYCFQSCACTEKCDKCSRLCNGDIDWYENIDNWTEYYNNGWIPCSERLPEEYTVLCCDNYGEMIVGHPYFDEVSDTNYTAESDDEMMYNCVAWQPLPEPYKEGE